jgi:hypothetical protein
MLFAIIFIIITHLSIRFPIVSSSLIYNEFISQLFGIHGFYISSSILLLCLIWKFNSAQALIGYNSISAFLEHEYRGLIGNTLYEYKKYAIIYGVYMLYRCLSSKKYIKKKKDKIQNIIRSKLKTSDLPKRRTHFAIIEDTKKVMNCLKIFGITGHIKKTYHRYGFISYFIDIDTGINEMRVKSLEEDISEHFGENIWIVLEDKTVIFQQVASNISEIPIYDFISEHGSDLWLGEDLLGVPQKWNPENGILIVSEDFNNIVNGIKTCIMLKYHNKEVIFETKKEFDWDNIIEERKYTFAKFNIQGIKKYNKYVKSAKNRSVHVGFDNKKGTPMLEVEKIDTTQMPICFMFIEITSLKDFSEIEYYLKYKNLGIHIVALTKGNITQEMKKIFPQIMIGKAKNKKYSRWILGEHGAERLLDKHDAWFVSLNGQKRIRPLEVNQSDFQDLYLIWSS